MNQELRVIIIIAGAFILGLCVLILQPNYRIPYNITSNADYYPNVIAGDPFRAEISDDAAIPSATDPSILTPQAADEQSNQDFEF